MPESMRSLSRGKLSPKMGTASILRNVRLENSEPGTLRAGVPVEAKGRPPCSSLAQTTKIDLEHGRSSQVQEDQPCASHAMSYSPGSRPPEKVEVKRQPIGSTTRTSEGHVDASTWLGHLGPQESSVCSTRSARLRATVIFGTPLAPVSRSLTACIESRL